MGSQENYIILASLSLLFCVSVFGSFNIVVELQLFFCGRLGKRVSEQRRGPLS